MSRTTNILDDKAQSQSLRMFENLERAYTIYQTKPQSPSHEPDSTLLKKSSNLGHLSIEQPIDESENEYKVPDTPIKPQTS